jgi:hypothetical protein
VIVAKIPACGFLSKSGLFGILGNEKWEGRRRPWSMFGRCRKWLSVNMIDVLVLGRLAGGNPKIEYRDSVDEKTLAVDWSHWNVPLRCSLSEHRPRV